jgi:ribosomal protein S18 acetylase RimI-like enzyme
MDLRDSILTVYAASHAELIDLPWWSPREFWDRLTDVYVKTADFDLVTGWLDERVLGYAFGSPSDGVVHQADVHRAYPQLEPAGPVYLFREFAVHPDFQRRGIGTQIHDELLRERPEKASLLLVRQDNLPAQAAYSRWGWVKAGTKKPFDDAPEFDALVLNLGSFQRNLITAERST